MLQPSIILLREGTDTSQGKPQLISNINACSAIVDVVRTTLGPRGMDKLIYDDKKKVTISNDGATIMKLLEIVHPAALTLVEIAKSQDSEVGDGTTTVVMLAGEFLKEAKPFIEEGVHPQIIIKAYRKASQLAEKYIQEIAIPINTKTDDQRRDLLEKCASTAMNSKLIFSQKVFFSKMVVSAVLHLDEDLNLDMIGIKKVTGGALQESIYVEGVAFKKTFSYAGFQQQPKRIESPKICLLNVELELKAEKDNAEIKIEKPEEYQSIVDAEWKIIFDKLDNIVKTGSRIVLSRLPIGDLATQYFADRDIFCAGRVPEEDLKRVAKATGGAIQSSVNDLIPSVLGTCAFFEERQVGGERFNFFTGCPQTKSATIILRGAGDQFIDEAERSLHDAIMIVKRTLKNNKVVGGGGAIEMKLSKYLRDYSRNIQGKEQLLINGYAKALEVIPRQLSENAGFDPTNILNQLRQSHATSDKWMGVDINNESICDTFENFVWEPVIVKTNAINAATQAANVILSVDETVRNPKSQENKGGPGGPGMGRGGMGRGRGGMRGGMRRR